MSKDKRIWKGCFGFYRTQEKGVKGNTHSLWTRVEETARRRVVSLLEENNLIETEGKNDRTDVNLLIQLQKC